MSRSVPDALRAFRSGDTEAFSVIYDSFADSIYRFCRYRVDDPEQAEDLTSQVFFKALRALRTFSGSTEDDVKHWLYRIARTTLIDSYRTAHPAESLDETYDHADDVRSISDSAGDRDLLERIRTYLDTLPDETREIVILRIWDGLSFAEIAALTNKTEDNCKQIASRTLRKIRIEFGSVTAFLCFLLLF